MAKGGVGCAQAAGVVSLPAQVRELKGTTGALEALYEKCAADNRALRVRLACREAELRSMSEQARPLRTCGRRSCWLLTMLAPALRSAVRSSNVQYWCHPSDSSVCTGHIAVIFFLAVLPC